MSAPNPTPYTRSFDFAAYQANNPTLPAPGAQISGELDALATSFASVVTALTDIRRSDGSVNNHSVAYDSLNANLQGLLGGFTPRGVWGAGTVYAAQDWIYNPSDFNLYVVPIGKGHTAGSVFATDLAAGKWMVASAGLNQTNVDTSVAAAMAAHLAASNPHPQYQIAATVAPVPIGAELSWAGVLPPAKYLLEYGQAISRSTYSALFGVLTTTTTATRANASPSLTSVAVDLTPYGLVGAYIEGTGIPTGTTITAVTSTTITMSASATSTGTASTIRVLPFGQGDGATTFNLPDRRGVALAGRDNMGGTAVGRLTYSGSGVDGSKLSTTGGSQLLHAHGHSVVDPTHSHTGGTTGSAGDHAHIQGSISLGSLYGGGTLINPISAPPGYYWYQNYDGGGDPAYYAKQAYQQQYTNTTGAHTHSYAVPAASTGITVSTAGAGGNQNVQPTGITNMIIYAGV